MTRSSSRRDLQPPQARLRTKAENMQTRKKPLKLSETANATLADLETCIIVNWNLSADTSISNCVPSKRWPLNEPDPAKWDDDIVRLLLEASNHSKGKNELFQLELSSEIASRQKRNRSAKGKADYMTAADLKKVCKRLESLAQAGKEAEQKDESNGSATRTLRRGRSKIKTQDDIKPRKIEVIQHTQAKKPTATKGRPKELEPNGQIPDKQETKRQPSNLPLRPARRLRNVKSPQPKPSVPPPVTPANPPEVSDEDDEEDQENAPPEPVSGRHIYGTYIPPTTVDFHASEPTAAAPPERQTRKRARAEEQPPTQVQIDSDPRDIDATGFLSELDPKEARRRRKPRLSRLEQDVIDEPAWSQDVCAVPETPGNVEEEGTESHESVEKLPRDAEVDLGVEALLQILPQIPEWATGEERDLLEGRVALLRKDIAAYEECIREIIERVEG